MPSGSSFPASGQRTRSPSRLKLERGVDAERPLSLMLVLAVLVVGVAGSGAMANSWRHTVATQDQRSFQAAASNVAATVTMAVQRDIDLLATTGTMLAGTPGMDNASFTRWFSSLDVIGNYPGSFGFAFVQAVTPQQLPAFAARAVADPPSGLPLPGGFHLQPPGVRPQYCLMRFISLQLPATLTRKVAAVPQAIGLMAGFGFFNPGVDECANGQLIRQQQVVPGQVTAGSFTALIGRADPGNIEALPLFRRVFKGLLPIELTLPVYSEVSAGAPPQLLGWMGGMFDLNSLLIPALDNRPGMSLVLSAPGSGGRLGVVARTGRPVPGALAQTLRMQTEGNWQLRLVDGRAGGWGPNVQGGVVLGVGVLLSLLLCVLLATLTRSRAVALDLVHQRTAELRHRALHDSLTDLPNRSLILERTDRALVRARSDGTPVALLFIDLDGFKDVNDSKGHGAGDELLCAAAQRFAAIPHQSATVGRLGGDEFVVLVEGYDAYDPGVLAKRLLDACSEPFFIESLPGVALSVSVSIGVAAGSRAAPGELLRDADIALYQAKEQGKNRFVVFEQEMRQAVRSRVDLEGELREAIDLGQFFLVYQPTFELGTMAVTGVEALIRWRSPLRGVVPPSDFIPALEETGLIADVGRFVLMEACRQTRCWHDLGMPLAVSVNVSARQLESDGLVDDVRMALAASGLDARALVVEITETALMRDATGTARRLHALKALGARVAVDDFGTGYSSMAYLKQFPVDVLKIDRSFVDAMSDGADGPAFVHALVQLGKVLHLETLAEGIEAEDQLSLLRGESCDSGQGFLFARPLEPADLEGFLTQHRVTDQAWAGTTPAATPATIS